MDSIVNQYCEKYGIDEDELKEATYKNLEKSHLSKKSDEEIVKDSADKIKSEEIHNDNDEHSDNYTNEHSEDDEFEHIHGTPWGNPNSD